MPRLPTTVGSRKLLRMSLIVPQWRNMKTPKPKTSSHGVRLRDDVWPLLRQVMRYHGRAWLERFIEREHRKLPVPQEVQNDAG